MRQAIDSRLWLALVLVLFCLPLFVGLSGRDVEGDEAIYSFAVDRMIETGDWLSPKSSPYEDRIFLEKPPLKFWIVAAPIRFGVLPHDQFGLRFWDALFGGVAFVYVFLIGSRLIHPMCGAAAVLILFAHQSLLFNHGLRSNTMEAPLLLAYCGGVFHFLAWARQARQGSGEVGTRAAGTGHAVAVGMYFILGFMTKFVAALFLPLVIAAVGLTVAEYRRSLAQSWRLWAGVATLVLALIVPWFAWAQLHYGSAVWQSMVGEHVIRRAVSSLDPTHIQPWYFYPPVIYARFRDSGSAGLVLLGMVALVVQAIRRRWPEGLAVVAWAVLPVVAMSASTSKLYHYTYPFLPPLALAAGYLATLAVLLAPAPFLRAVHALDQFTARHLPRLMAAMRHGLPRSLLVAVSVGALATAFVSVTYGPIRFPVGATELRSSGVFRPAIVAFVCALLAGGVRNRSRQWVAVLVLALLPLRAYRQSIGALFEEPGPVRTVRDCILTIQSGLDGASAHGLYVDMPDAAMTHSLYYYFRQVRPWIRADRPSTEPSGHPLNEQANGRPSLIGNSSAAGDRQFPPPGTSPDPLMSQVAFSTDVTVLLPGPYATCIGQGTVKSDPPL